MDSFRALTPKERRIQKVIVTTITVFGMWVMFKWWVWDHIKYPLTLIGNKMNEILETYKHDIVKAFFTGIFGGMGVFIVKALWDVYIFWRDEKRIYTFFRHNTSFEFYTTHRISSSVDLPESRVAYICGTSKKIKRNEGENQTWKLR